jgi:hypothetical protein
MFRKRNPSAALLSSLAVLSAWLSFRWLYRSGREDQTHAVGKSLGISVVDGVLAFHTVEDYRRAVDNPTEHTRAELKIAIAGYPEFRSYLATGESRSRNVFDDPFFESLLNADQIVQIGGQMFRVDPKRETVLVIPATSPEDYRDLVAENISNERMVRYSTGDDVLERVFGNPSAPVAFGLGWFCKEGGVGGDSAEITFSHGGSNYQTLASFNRYGIYFSLFAKVFPSTGSNQFLFEFDHGFGYIHWHARCGPTSDYGTTSAGNMNGNSEQRFQSYQASANLANFFFGYRILKKSTNLPLTGMNVIRKNW